MGNLLDVFNSDAFSTVEMTAAINDAPYVPGRIGALGLFQQKPMGTTTVTLERKGNTIALLPSKPRGSGQTTKRHVDKREQYVFTIPHIPHDDELFAADLQNVRAFGEDADVPASPENAVNDKLAGCRQNHELTHEYHRVGACRGVVVDGDTTTTLVDLYSTFSISRVTVDFNLDNSSTDVRAIANTIRRIIQNAIGSLPFTSILAIVGDNFWDGLTNHPNVKNTYDLYQSGNYLRSDPRAGATGQAISQFPYCDIMWENYRGSVGGTAFVGTNEAMFIPIGVPNFMLEHFAPGDMMEAVNTEGLVVYAQQKPKDWNLGIDIRTQSNPAMICTRPQALIGGVYT